MATTAAAALRRAGGCAGDARRADVAGALDDGRAVPRCASVRERLRFTSNACSEALMVPDGESAPLDGDARALGLYEWAMRFTGP
ncbi:MAG: hypothetical protein SFW67_20825 [Myxococcaceae bacterium]|nr:hypothetical protein [Myxococcaceae bacterium]